MAPGVASTTLSALFVKHAHTPKQQARLAITLSWIAGYTNILTLITCGQATSHISGTMSQLGRDFAEGRLRSATYVIALLAAFLLGAALSGFLTELGRRLRWRSIYVLPMAVEAVMLALFALFVDWEMAEQLDPDYAKLWLTVIPSAAMGLQNATITRISSGVVRTTHMTGVFTDLGLESVQFLFWLRDRNRNSPPLPVQTLAHSLRSHPSARRLGMLLSVVGSFAVGAGLGAAAYERFPHWAMYPPVAFLLWVIVQDVRRPICEIEASPLAGGASLPELPEALAVYHLRKDRGRTGAVHRLPNLLAWSERLPERVRVVILDLGQAASLDDNAVLELRSLMQRLRGQGRELVIAGVDAPRFRAIMHAGAGDVLDPTNVCPDLELAVARGFTLLDGLSPAA